MKNSLLKGYFLIGALLCFGWAQAQTITGTVNDALGPLPGANVVVKGTANGTQTDFDGNYTLDNVASGAVLVFSYVGFKAQEVAVGNRNVINVTLEEDAQALSEVVVIGYGTTTVKDATGSVAAVTSEDFNGGVISSPEQLIQGKTAGVQISQSSGEPGAGIDVRIRGSNSIRSNNNPLFVIDGIPVTNESTSPAGGDIVDGGGSSRNPLSFLNPSDIESISILKDASATAIYGSRGANGVVIITTKSGKGSSGGNWEFSSSLSYSEPGNDLDLLTRSQFLTGIETVASPAAALAAVQGNADTDWEQVITRSVVSQNQNLSYSNNYGKGNVRATFGYGKQFGVLEKTNQERITGRLNLAHRFLDDKLKLGLQASISRVNDEAAPTSGASGFRGNIIGAAYTANPTWPSDPDFFFAGAQVNPSNYLENFQSLTHTDRYLINFSTEYDITSELTGKVNLGYDNSESEVTSVVSGNVNNFDRVPGNGQGSYNTLNLTSRLIEATLKYYKEFDNSTLDALIGYSYQEFERDGFNSQAWGFNTTDLNGMGNALRSSISAGQNAISGSYQQFGLSVDGSSFVNRLDLANNTVNNTDIIPDTSFAQVRSLWFDNFDNSDELQSFFGRLNYTLNDKYLFTATIRADGSSRFSEDNQYGYFPSGAFAWKLHEEDFMGETFSTLKFRVGAGLTGNQEGLGYAEFLTRIRFAEPSIEGSGNINRPGTDIVANQNEELKWEQVFDLNVGIDFGFNDDRLSGSIDFYRKETQDLLFRQPAAAPSDTPFIFKNLEDGSVLNTGVELALNYDFIQTENVTFSTSFNISYVDNEVRDLITTADLSPLNGPGLTGGFAQRLDNDRSLYSYYLAVFEGFDASGNPIYEDVDGDGTGDVFLDRKFVGEDALPDVNAGLSLNFSYKNWDLSTYLTGQFGFSVYNNTANAFSNTDILVQSRNAQSNVLTATLAGQNIASAPSTFYLEDGDFVRMQSASIGYNVPLTGEGLFKSMRLSLTGQNLFLITDYSGLDPEVRSNTGDIGGSGIPSAGIDYTAFPRPRTITFGLNARF